MVRERTVSTELEMLQSLRQTSAAKLLNIGRSTLAESSDAPRNEDGSYSAPALIRWFVAKRLAETAADPMLGASNDCPHLARYRKIRADLLQLEYEEKCGALVSVEHTRCTLARWASLIRNKVEQLGHRYGRELVVSMTETLCQCRDLIQTGFPANETGEGETND